MKKTVILPLFLAFSALFSLCACKKAIRYTDQLHAEELAEEALEELDHPDFQRASGDWLSDYVTLPEGLNDYEIRFSSDGNNLNEFGIWHVRDDQVAPMEATLRAYLAESLLRNRDFYDSYIPTETPKLANAEVRVFGNYVCYAILDDKDRSTFFHTVEEELIHD